MGVLGYSAERHLQIIREESFEAGFKAGYDKYQKDITELYAWLFKHDRISDFKKAIEDSDYRKELYKEFTLANKNRD